MSYFRGVIIFVTITSIGWLFRISVESGFGEPSFPDILATRILPLVLIVGAVVFFKPNTDPVRARKTEYFYYGFLFVSLLTIFGYGSAAENTKYQCYTESALVYQYANNCYANISIATNDPQLCQQQSEAFAQCHFYFAEKLGSAYKCPEASREMCLFRATVAQGNSPACSFLQEVKGNIGRNSCYYSIALKNSDSTLCASIEPDNASGSENKRGYCYLELAIKTKNSNLCERIENSTRRYDCLKGLEAQ